MLYLKTKIFLYILIFVLFESIFFTQTVLAVETSPCKQNFCGVLKKQVEMTGDTWKCVIKDPKNLGSYIYCNQGNFEFCKAPFKEADRCCTGPTDKAQQDCKELNQSYSLVCGTIKEDTYKKKYCDYTNDNTPQNNNPSEYGYYSCLNNKLNDGKLEEKCCATKPECSNTTPMPTGCGKIGKNSSGVPVCIKDNNENVKVAAFTACVENKGEGYPCCFGPEEKDVTNACKVYRTVTPTPIPSPTPKSVFSPYSPPSNKVFDALNPLKHAGGETIFIDQASEYASQLSTPGGIISRVLAFIFPLAGLILFVMLVWGGFEVLIQAPEKKAIDAGKQRVTAALLGFILLFASYWIWQIVEVVFGVKIL